MQDLRADDRRLVKLADADRNSVTPNGMIRADQRMVHDMYVVQVKTPAESKGPWDFVKLVTTVLPEEAFPAKRTDQ
jgi:hypothetical protein